MTRVDLTTFASFSRALMPLLILALVALSGCDQQELEQRALEEAQKLAEEKLAELKEAAETELSKTLEELSKRPPSPWDVSWLPSDSQMVASRIDIILNGTGLSGQGYAIRQYAQEFGVNPAFALAMFRKEASFAKPDSRANKNKNPGNIEATGACREESAGSSCNGYYGEISTDGRFGVYPDMADGVRAYFLLLSSAYRPGTRRNCSDIGCIINAYCPPADCDTSYIDLGVVQK